MRIHYYLEIDNHGKIRCLKCGQTLCEASENYKKHVPRTEVWPDEIPGQHPTKSDALVLYYEYYCPGCFTLLDVEIAEKGAPPLWDIQTSISLIE
jgi:acetone carboxylase gamma subunit